MITQSPLTQNYRVLVATPHADAKNYCFDDFLSRVKSLSYKNYDILIADNSENSNNYHKIIKSGVKAIHVKRKNKELQQVLADTHEAIRIYALQHNYDYILHLESDVFPPHDVIERLMIHNLPVVSAMYMINFGHESNLMAQVMEDFGDTRETANLKDGEDLNLIDGKIKKVFANGLGCSLIRRDVLEQVAFRWEKGAIIFPDSIFAYDCDSVGIEKHIDTSILCEHRNSNWTQHLSKLEK